MDIANEIEKLDNLRQRGAISEQEYQEAKTNLLRKTQSVEQKLGNAIDVNTWSMFIHLSQFCGYVVPLAGLIVPIILWQIKKAESEIIDRHGKIVVNWIISAFLYGIVFGLLCLLLIGIPLLIILGVLAIVFPIIGGIKANNGEVWPYPLSIKFFK